MRTTVITIASLMAFGLVGARPAPGQNGYPDCDNCEDWHGGDSWHPEDYDEGWSPHEEHAEDGSKFGLGLASDIVNTVGNALHGGASLGKRGKETNQGGYPQGYDQNGPGWSPGEDGFPDGYRPGDGYPDGYRPDDGYNGGGGQWGGGGDGANWGGESGGRWGGGRGGGGDGGYQQALCPGLPGVPQCCEVNLLGLVATSCKSTSGGPRNVEEFQDSCKSVGQTAQCCLLPAAGSGVACNAPSA